MFGRRKCYDLATVTRAWVAVNHSGHGGTYYWLRLEFSGRRARIGFWLGHAGTRDKNGNLRPRPGREFGLRRRAAA